MGTFSIQASIHNIQTSINVKKLLIYLLGPVNINNVTPGKAILKLFVFELKERLTHWNCHTTSSG
jgi:hypothetical protein